MKTVFLFDMDGVLWDSSEAHAKAFMSIIRNNNLPIRDFRYPTFAGMSTDKAWTKLLRDHDLKGLGEKDVAELTYQKRHEFSKASSDLITNDRLLEQAAKFNQSGWGIVTSGSPESAAGFLRNCGFASRFEIVITREDVLEAKPSPEGYLLAAERFQVEPGDCIVFEDSSAGIQAALEAGMRVIHVLPSDVSDCITHQSPKFEKGILGCTEFSGSSVERILGGHLK